ncbi:MAG: hypothetical protein JJU18_03855 [Oceanicaulis sp.]|nr:hypothetical protein [Oceanicaulis sp.]
MKRPGNRFPVDTLIILGAGASYASTLKRSKKSEALIESVAPLDKDFCDRIKKHSDSDLDWVKLAKDRLCKGWLDEKEFNLFGLEEAIIRQTSHMEFLNAIQPRRRAGITDQEEYINLISHVITYILSRCGENNKKLYNKLYQRYFGEDSYFDDGEYTGQPRNRVISFNYDYIFDQYLLGEHDPFRVYFDKINLNRDAGERRHERHDFPYLLKLHGSANWIVDTKDFKKVIGGRVEDDSYLDNIHLKKFKSHMPKPDDARSPLIIPPVPNKPVTKISLFKFLWTRASEYIESAERIVICGYSLPEADAMAQMLFRRMRNASVEEIIIVDPDAAILGKWMDLFSSRNNKRAEWKYYRDFDSFCSSL